VTARRSFPLPLEVSEYYDRSIEMLDVVRRLSVEDPAHQALKGSSFALLTATDREVLLLEMRSELDSQVALTLMASYEAVLRADFEARIRRKPRSTRGVNKSFKELSSRYQGRVALDDILATWKGSVGARPAVFHTFGEYLRLRHWLAHGRRWTLKVTRAVDPADIKEAADELLRLLPEDFPLLGG
jgi:hypothetical protein